MEIPKNGEYVTKKDLEETKQELLAKLATKEELKQTEAKLASKKDLNKLGKTVDQHTSDIAELKADMKIVKLEQSQFRADMKAFEKKTDEKFDRVFTILDGISGQLLDIKTEMAAFNYTFGQHQNRLDNHEVRITNLEQKKA